MRIVRALKHFDNSGVPQVPQIAQMAYYQRGAGTDTGMEDYVYGGFTGSDVAEQYVFLRVIHFVFSPVS